MKKLVVLIFVLYYGHIVFSQDLTKIPTEKPLRISGSVMTSSNFYSTNNTTSIRDPFLATLSGNINVNVYGISLPFSFMYSNKNFTYGQPFNRFGVSPEYKWIKAHLGYRSINYSKFTLAGHSFLGGGLELNPGLFRFSAVYGRFKKKITPNTINPIDTLFTPSRIGYSVKIGIGSDKTFFDLIALKISDDTLTAFQNINESYKEQASNLVFGTHFIFPISKNIKWETEGSISLMTRNVHATILTATDDKTLSFINNYFKVNESTYYATALLSALQYTNSNFNFGLQYRRIAPDYLSFGAYYFTTDIEHITLNSAFKLFKKKLNLRGNIGIQNDNLKNNKASNSRKLISAIAAGYNSGKIFAIDGNYSNYSINQYAGRLPLNDTLKLYQDNRTLSLSPRLTFQSEKALQLVQVNISSSDVIDHNEHTAQMGNITTSMALLNYNRNNIKSGVGFTTGLNYITMKSSFENRIMTGINLGVSKPFLKNKITTNFACSVNRSTVNDFPGSVLTSSLSANYRPSKSHNFRFNLNFNNNQYPVDAPVKSYRETKILFSYAYNF